MFEVGQIKVDHVQIFSFAYAIEHIMKSEIIVSSYIFHGCCKQSQQILFIKPA